MSAPINTTPAPVLPETMRALVLESRGSLAAKSIPTPQPTAGSAVVRILATAIEAAARSVLKGESAFSYPDPHVPGGRAIGRVAAVGPDAISLKVGQLVMLEPFIRARDDRDTQLLWGTFDGQTPAGHALAAVAWRDGVLAEYARAPLENVHALDEAVLCGEMGYSHGDLAQLPGMAVVYGGLRGVDLRAGETIVVAPATGAYSGASVPIALAVGARVIAAGRNLDKLKKVQATFPQVKIVKIKGDVEADVAALQAHGPIDVFFDMSPPAAAESTHIRSGLMALKPYGRASLMGYIMKDIAIPYAIAVFHNLTIRGQYMYEREDVRGLIKLVESGTLKLGNANGRGVCGRFELDDIEKAFDAAESQRETGLMALVEPAGITGNSKA